MVRTYPIPAVGSSMYIDAFIIALFGGGGGLVLGAAMVGVGVSVFMIAFTACVIYGLFARLFEMLGITKKPIPHRPWPPIPPTAAWMNYRHRSHG